MSVYSFFGVHDFVHDEMSRSVFVQSSEMPIDDLLDLCNVPIRPPFFTTSSLSYTNFYMASDSRSSLAGGSADNTNETTYSSSEDEILSNQDLTLDKDEIARDLLLSRGEGHDRETSVSDLITVLDMPPSQPDISCTEPSLPRMITLNLLDFIVTISTLCLKNDTDVAHYVFNAHQQILTISRRDVTERVCYQMVIYYPTFSNYCLCSTWGNMNPRN